MYVCCLFPAGRIVSLLFLFSFARSFVNDSKHRNEISLLFILSQATPTRCVVAHALAHSLCMLSTAHMSHTRITRHRAAHTTSEAADQEARPRAQEPGNIPVVARRQRQRKAWLEGRRVASGRGRSLPRLTSPRTLRLPRPSHSTDCRQFTEKHLATTKSRSSERVTGAHGASPARAGSAHGPPHRETLAGRKQFRARGGANAGLDPRSLL